MDAGVSQEQLAFNRTKVECKYINLNGVKTNFKAFNRNQ